ncbi:putative Hydroxyacyl-thioester dehydratase type 2, mitochondrial [Thiocapsa sp. KS1]|nr:MaoC/PaaZ C-terminal domain-containing protein [Thiocapsa sp. KS1]CRI64725.1 putative Hydroxyacyl-thioester dehydratase type 2, mitochondrial [Thiocapsa sp. KS1]
MTPTRCLTAAMLEVGMRHEARLSFSREEVDRYCALVGDHNAIHRDLDAARVRFPDARDIVVPGGLVQTRISALFGTEFPGDGTLGLTFSPERLRRPLYPGDELVVTLEVARLIRGGIVEMQIGIADPEGNRISEATAKVVAPDAAYRAWWETNIDGAESER